MLNTMNRIEYKPARDLFSLREAIVLADVPERRVRKDIETGVLTPPHVTRIDNSRLYVHWTFVVTLAAVYGNAAMSGNLRKTALSRMGEFSFCRSWLETRPASENRVIICTSTPTIDIDRYLQINLEHVCKAVKPRMSMYIDGLSRVEEKDDVLGGEAVFKDSRLPVAHVGKMLENGESVQNILEDYPYLDEGDIEFAKLYCRAHPSIGRPRLDAGAVHYAVDDA